MLNLHQLKLIATLLIWSSLSLVSCNREKSITTNAMDCANIVQSYLGIPDQVTVAKFKEIPQEKQVDIEYQSQNDENIPVEGIASCIFGKNEQGKPNLVSVKLNGNYLTANDIIALNKQVKLTQK